MNQRNKRQGALPAPVEGFFGFVETFFITMMLASLLFIYFLRVTTINGESMLETLHPDDKVIMTAFYGEPHQGDIVVLDAKESVTMNEAGELVKGRGMDKLLVKRIIACEGQTVSFDFQRGIVYVDGEEYRESYISGLTHTDEGAFTGNYPVTVPEGYVFVLGDNRRNSRDSRSSELGFVDVDNIIGKVLFRIAPYSDIGKVD